MLRDMMLAMEVGLYHTLPKKMCPQRERTHVFHHWYILHRNIPNYVDIYILRSPQLLTVKTVDSLSSKMRSGQLCFYSAEDEACRIEGI